MDVVKQLYVNIKTVVEKEFAVKPQGKDGVRLRDLRTAIVRSSQL